MYKANDTNLSVCLRRGINSTSVLTTALVFLLLLSSNMMAQKVPTQSNSRQLIQAKRMPGTLLTDRFGVTPALQGSNILAAGYQGNEGVDPGGRPFDWPTLVPTLNTTTVDWTEGDYIGRWNTNFNQTSVAHTTAPGTPDQDWEPSGGENFDVEALYFDNDADSFYVAIITSMAHVHNVTGSEDVGIHDPRTTPADQVLVRTGDLAISLFEGPATTERDGTLWHYDYGVDVSHENRDVTVSLPPPFATQVYPSMRNNLVGNELYSTSGVAGGSDETDPAGDWYTSAAGVNAESYWEQTNFDPQDNTFSGALLGTVRSHYYELVFAGGVLENDYPTYVYEFSIPRALFGASNPGDGERFAFRLIPGCRNDGHDENAGEYYPNLQLTGLVDDHLDYGDAPDVYDTTLASSGASHIIGPELFLGSVGPDEDTGLVAAADNDPATGDDTTGSDDEDGKPLIVVSSSTSALTMSVSATNNSTTRDATLNCWIDFNDDGDFGDSGESATSTVSVPQNTGTNGYNVSFAPAAVAAAGSISYYRCRIAFVASEVANPAGLANSGEVEDCEFTINDIDYGDAPDLYATTEGNGGASHIIDADLFLGSVVPDADDGTIAAADNDPATGDDTSGSDDEDGKPMITVSSSTSALTMSVNATNNSTTTDATLNCWIDFNDDGDFGDSGEAATATASVPQNSGTNGYSMSFAPAAVAAAGEISYYRCRIAYVASEVANPGGAANSGEVEDCEFTITDIDYGDAPDLYATTEGNGGASHIIDADLFLGSVVPDADDGTVAAADNDPATGDDTTGSDDEDGKPMIMVSPSTTALTMSVTATNNSTTTDATLNCWIDFNDDGDFGDSGETATATASVPQNTGTASYSMSFAPAAVGSAGDVSYYRCRIAYVPSEVASPAGAANSGEVEDCEFTISDEVDYGDAPDSYATDASDDGGDPGIGASHLLIDDLYLGACVDSDADGVPATTGDAAIGDDTTASSGVTKGTCAAPGADEDGITSKPALDLGATTADLTVSVFNNAGSDAFVACWIDFDLNGTFDADERAISSAVSSSASSQPIVLTFDMSGNPPGAAGQSYTRCRLSQQASELASAFGPATSGEVEDCEVSIGTDWGDAPDSYNTSLVGNGPRHVVNADLMLGSAVDVDGNGQANNTDSSGDDTDPEGDDEDGIPTILDADILALTYTLDVNATNSTGSDATLACWIDFDINGTFDAGERVEVTVASPAVNPNSVVFNTTGVFSSTGSSYIRCRLATASGEVATPNGSAASGEIEDHPIEFTTLLAVELAEFDVVVDEGNAILTWATASEENNAGFAIEYARGNDSFTEHAFVEGKGTTQDRNEYSYTITGLSPDSYRFRLKQVDFDGSFDYSPIIEAGVDLPGTFVLEAAYPNPFNPSTNIRFAVRESQPVTLKLYDLMGREVELLFAGVPNAKESLLVKIDASGLQSGSYIVRLEGDSFTSSQKITLLK